MFLIMHIFIHYSTSRTHYGIHNISTVVEVRVNIKLSRTRELEVSCLLRIATSVAYPLAISPE